MSGVIDQELESRGVTQVLVYLKTPPGAGSPAAAAAALGTVARHFHTAETSFSGQLAAVSSSRARARSGRKGVRGGARDPYMRHYPNLGLMLGTVDRRGLAALRADKRVQSVSGAPQLSLIRPTRRAAASASKGTTWGIEALRVPELWKKGISGEGVLVGHLDTGVDGKHPALKQAVAHFAQFDDFGARVSPDPRPFESDEHGTHTAATIAGRTANGRRVGVAPGARLASALVIEGGDTVARVLGGMDWAVGLNVRVLSMSLGFRGWWEDFVQLTQLLRERGVLPVFAVGNEGPGTSRSPGNYAEALSVGACDERKRVPNFSSSQRFQRKRDPEVPDLVAPGMDVVSAMPGGGYQSMDGSSMATPHVAGLAALLLEAHPDAKVDRLEKAILASCKLAPKMVSSRSGRGLPDAMRALDAL